MDTKWFKLEIQISESGIAVLAGDAGEKNTAVTDFHSAMASLRAAVDAGTLQGATCMVLNTLGGTDPTHCEHYPDNVVEPEPNE